MINNLTTKTEVVAFTLTSAELEKFGLNEALLNKSNFC